jgi:PAS domain S-box-containing protein
MPTDKKPPRRPLARKAGAGRRGSRVNLDNDARKQLHELQVHQVELEMQNKELRKVREELDTSLARYTSLYQQAPVGYLTLGQDGSILDLNQAAAQLLGGGHREWRRSRFDSHLAQDNRSGFSGLLLQLLHDPGARTCEADMQRPDGSTFCAQISVTYQSGSGSYLMVLTDATARRDAMQRARAAEQLAQKLLAQNRHLTRRMFERLEDDRRRIGDEIHKELDRRFSTVYREMAAVIRAEHRLSSEVRPHIRTITANLAEMQNGLRRVMLRLRPRLLDLAGIGEAVREFVQRWQERHPGVRCALTLEGDFQGVPDATSIALFRVVQGAMANVANHAHASRAVVRLARQAGMINLVIDDDGEGFDPAAIPPGVGLLEMRERVAALDGQFEFTTKPNSGVRIEVYLPVTPQADAGDAQHAGVDPMGPNA